MPAADLNHQSIRAHFIERFQREPLLVRSPGRINLIGEHTDYNDGFVMPAAIDKEIIFAFAPSDDSHSKIYAADFNEFIEINLTNPQPVKSPQWANYILGVARQFVDKGALLKPFYCVFGGNIPSGSGLSSSAALEGGFALVLQQLNDQNFSRIELAKIGQWSEHNFVGVQCGIMDQFANLMGKENHVIRLDCRSMEYEYLPFHLKDYSVVLFNSGVKHSLASSEYNVRRNECEVGIELLQKKYASISSLRDVSISMLDEVSNELPMHVFNRCKYVVEEIGRVQHACDDLKRDGLASFGRRMFQTHDGLSKLYEVSCAELDYLVSSVENYPAVIGARMMGGGFGGCTINIIHKDSIDTIMNSVAEKYRKKFQIEIEIYQVSIVNGASLIG